MSIFSRRPLPLPARYRPSIDLTVDRQRVASRSISWSAKITHIAVSFVKAQLVASVSRSRGIVDEHGCPRCAIQVWAERRVDFKSATAHTDEAANARGGHGRSAQPERLVQVSGSICPKNSGNALHVQWLGRQKFGSSVDDDWRFLDEESQATLGGQNDRILTVAEALVGMLTVIATLFGARIVQLDADDRGSGKLVRYYERLGFVADRSPNRDGVRMRVPVDTLSRLAPTAWVKGLIPVEFDALGWLWSDFHEPPLSMMLSCFCVPLKSCWKVMEPLGASLDTMMTPHDASSTIRIQASMKTKHGGELVFVKATMRLRQRSLRVVWLGTSGSGPAHPSVKGKPMYTEKVTAAVGLLGVVATLARWFGTASVEITALDTGSGRLIVYLKGLGFENARAGGVEPAAIEAEALDEQPALTAKCEDIVQRCCPAEWRDKLPSDDHLQIMASMIDKR
eukprot:TRINITY_DN21380_c0_g1_i1.p1 TRINITY_DN21380_c0_g1~~TRINITY_DN21380_c0_g1_i1.p1  ORF type:complete len:453 (+),score=44.97 TRINITY_DN21380_c0_g1_i1:57-1415(+)